ncbi:hypothetical protein [Spirosoma sp.]|uniref:hypothetical protein n=1 Tax=Spirosoma sp. TaxID=1899569 RepID=UPI00261322B3|nr:hypothetical protein [Spirosoma sp.]MCX6215810.1 hypothetical protein [Spirosoma sp.]
MPLADNDFWPLFPRQSGAVQGRYAKNRFELTTSRVGSLTIYLSPEMINFDQPLQVVINGKQVYNRHIEYDRAFLLAQYAKEMDHQALWVNRLTFPVK